MRRVTVDGVAPISVDGRRSKTHSAKPKHNPQPARALNAAALA